MLKYSFFQGIYFEDIDLEQEYEISCSQILKSKFKIFFGHSAVILSIYLLYSFIFFSSNYYVFFFIAFLFVLIFLFYKNFKYLTIISIVFSFAKKVFLFESLVQEIDAHVVSHEEATGIYFFAIYVVLLTITQTCFCSNNAFHQSIYILTISFYLTSRMVHNPWMGFILIFFICVSVLINLFYEEIRKRKDFLKNFFQMNDLKFYKHILDQEFKAAALVLSSRSMKRMNSGFGFYRKFKHQTSKLKFYKNYLLNKF